MHFFVTIGDREIPCAGACDVPLIGFCNSDLIAARLSDRIEGIFAIGVGQYRVEDVAIAVDQLDDNSLGCDDDVIRSSLLWTAVGLARTLGLAWALRITLHRSPLQWSALRSASKLGPDLLLLT